MTEGNSEIMETRTYRRGHPKIRRGYRFSIQWLQRLRGAGIALEMSDTEIIEDAVNRYITRRFGKSFTGTGETNNG